MNRIPFVFYNKLIPQPVRNEILGRLPAYHNSTSSRIVPSMSIGIVNESLKKCASLSRYNDVVSLEIREMDILGTVSKYTKIVTAYKDEKIGEMRKICGCETELFPVLIGVGKDGSKTIDNNAVPFLSISDTNTDWMISTNNTSAGKKNITGLFYPKSGIAACFMQKDLLKERDPFGVLLLVANMNQEKVPVRYISAGTYNNEQTFGMIILQ